MALTTKICDAPNKTGKRERRGDGNGLQLCVSPQGAKRWEFIYRFHGRQRALALGAYPGVSLSAARAVVAQHRLALETGRDPGARPEQEAVGRPFKTVVEAWFQHVRDGWTPAYADRVWARLRGDVIGALGDKAADEIGHADVAAMVLAIEARGAPVMARRVRQHVEKIFAWYHRAEPARPNPAANAAADLRPRSKRDIKRRARLRENELPVFFARLDAYEGERLTALALEFVVRTAVRTSEVRLMTWAEVEGDIWRIPSDRMKMGGADHLVPLAPGAREVLRDAKAIGKGAPYCFPGERGRPMSQNTLIYALYRMGYHSRATTHGFRATFSTAANESGLWHPDWIEMQLAHSERDDVRAAYNSALYLPQRRNLMTWWDARVSEAKGVGEIL